MISLIILITGCVAKKHNKNPENWTDRQVSEWFDKKDWLGQTALQPDSSIDKKEFAIQYNRNKERWDKAFHYIKDKDLSALSVGEYELDNQKVLVIVSEYNSKSPEVALFEEHEDYIDIHYVVSGSEYIELGDQSTAKLKKPYDEEKDIAFYEAKEKKILLAKPGIFFIIFPGELHKPGIKVEESNPVKKILIKIRKG
jgi:YhcH/YjgK/YiaL family protein